MASFFRLGGVTVCRNSFSIWNRTSALEKNKIWVRCLHSSSFSAQEPAKSQVIPGEDYWDKNKRLNRPMSPHLTIYKPQLTSMLSITHRGTGLALAGMLSGFSIGMMCLSSPFPYYHSMLAMSHYGPAIVFGIKFLLAFPFTFHMLNGIRHLTWDLGFGFSLKSLYMSGYGVLALALLLAGGLASY